MSVVDTFTINRETANTSLLQKTYDYAVTLSHRGRHRLRQGSL